MSYVDAKKAIEKKLATLSGVIATAREGISYDAVVGVPYQRINFIPGIVEDLTTSRKLTRYTDIVQITLFYPSPVSTGTTLPDAMAKKIQDLFKPVQTLTEGSTKVMISSSPSRKQGFPDGDRWVIPISIQYYYDIYG